MIQNWNIGLPYSFSIIPRVLLKVKKGVRFLPDYNCTSLEYRIMVPRTLKPPRWGTSAAATGKRYSNKSKSIVHPLTVEKSLTRVARLPSKKIFRLKEFEKTYLIITNLRWKGTLFSYESTWRKWDSWCNKRKNYPFQAPVNDIIE